MTPYLKSQEILKFNFLNIRLDEFFADLLSVIVILYLRNM